MSGNVVVPGFESIIGQQLPIRILQRFISAAMIPHALLFTGIEGVGKRTAARCLAMALHCGASQPATETGPAGVTNLPCGQCRSCRQIADGNHPDTIEITPRKGVLRIDQIRGLLTALAMKPFGGGRRVVIVADAQAMNAEAGNALLKVLEEPPADTILILTARQRTDLLPTISSRCRHIRFNPLPPDDLAALLKKEHGMEEDRARTLAEAADGSVTKALRLSAAGWQAQRDWVLRASGLDQPHLCKTRSATACLTFAARLAQRKETIESDLEILKGWIRDLSVWPYAPRHVIHRDRSATLQGARAGIGERQLTALWEVVELAQKAIAANSNLRLTLDVMALRMSEALSA
jgi:DNA polymerase-3 subunit delta'